MKTYWWKTPDGENFGDDLTRFILKAEGLDFEWSKPHDAELILTGSILEHMPRHWAGSVCGAGKLHERSRIHLADARVFALRGKLTRSGVSGVRHDVALGDPGLLVPRWVRQPQAKHNLGVLPHWSDTELAQRFSYGHLIDAGQPADKVVQQIAECKSLVTSSLHGIIVADAFGIPRQAELAPCMLDDVEGGEFKWHDYCSVYDERPHFGHMHTVPRDKVERVQDELLAALHIAVGIDLPGVGERRDPALSLLVPFRDDGEHRGRVWRWLRRYWRERGLDAEIIQGWDDHSPFSKANAVNNAARLARGRTFAILDADAYLVPEALERCADDIEGKMRRGRHTWYMPYNRLYRLNQKTTLDLIAGDASASPITAAPPQADLEPVGTDPHYGHMYGAMAQVMPREAFWAVGGMDPRFRGWGCEDISLLRALDALWGHHEVADEQVLHFWHARIGSKLDDRQWVGQTWGAANSRLAQRYAGAIAEPEYMRGLAAEHPLGAPLYH